MSQVCESCGQPVRTASRVSIHGMYDMHLFHSINGKTVDEIIDNWIAHNSQIQPAIVGNDPVDDMGPSNLCPAIVLDGDDKELRRVGQMVFPDPKDRRAPRDPLKLEAYRQALLNDADIPRLLAASS